MSYKSFLWLILLLSCNAEDFELNEDNLLKENEFTFFSAITIDVAATDLLRKVAFNGKIEQTYRCLEEAGFFYSKQSDLLYQEQADFKSLESNSAVTLVEIPIDSLRGQETGFQFTYEFPIEELGETYFFRAYANFKNDCDSVAHERVYLEQVVAPKSISLRNGWYRVPFEGDLWDRTGGIAVNMADKLIIGGGCAYPSHCGASIEGYPFLQLDQEENIEVLTELSAPVDKPGGDLFNRLNGVAFSLGDSIYFGTGEIDSKVTSNFYAFAPNQTTRAREIQLPISFEPRTKAVGFAINGKGYVGLGEAEDIKPDGTPAIFADVFDDFWEFNPNAVFPDSQWTKLVIRIDPTSTEKRFKARKSAVGFSVKNEYAVIGGGVPKFSAFSDFWEFRPHPDSAIATLKYINSLEDEAGKAVKINQGIGFEIEGEIFVGLGSTTNLFFQLKNGIWKQVKPLPDLRTFDGIGFSNNNKGFLFSGITKDEDRNETISNDLWVYIPEN